MNDTYQNLMLQAGATGFSPRDLTVLIIIILVLLTLTAIIAGAETAFFSLKAKDINYLKTKDQPNARQAIRLLDQPRILLASMLVSKTFFNIAIIIATNMLINILIAGMVDSLAILLAIKVISIAFLLVLFGEVLPKVYATQNNMRMAMFSAPVMNAFYKIFRPVSDTLVASSSYIEEKLAAKPGTTASLSPQDFEQAIELTLGHTATREEVNIFKGIVKFGSITARQIMRTRLDVSGVPEQYTFAQVQQAALEAGYSRMPVYKQNLDQITGILHTKDFLLHAADENFDWHVLIRPAYFIHEGKLIEDLLKEFQQRGIHFAAVVDEFGGTSGIVTLEDIMEEIIGEISDEFDREDLQYRKIDDYNYLFEGKTLINDAARRMGIPSEIFDVVRGESDSLAGLVLEIAGKFPGINETVSFRNFDFTVLETDRMRVTKVKVTLNPEEE